MFRLLFRLLIHSCQKKVLIIHNNNKYTRISLTRFVCVCLLLRNLGECLISLLVQPIAGKNVSPNKALWQFSISRHIEISSFLAFMLMSAENTQILIFVSLKFCFLDFVHRHNEFFLSYLWSFVQKFTSTSLS